jgi:hypothetical protein
MTAWRWVIGPWDAGPERELTYLYGRQLQFTINAPAQAMFNLPGQAPECAELAEGETDLWVWSDEDLMYRGRIIQTTDSISSNVHTVSVSSVDYRGVLGRRILVEGDAGNVPKPPVGNPGDEGYVPPQVGYSMATYAAIAWDLVYKTQIKPGGNLRIIQGTWVPDPAQPPSGYRIRTYDLGLEVGKAVDDLSDDATFDYEIRPNPNDPSFLGLFMNLWAPGKSRDQDLILDLGGTVTALTRSFSISNWANVTRVSGSADRTTGVNSYTARPEGRWESQIGYPDVVLQSTVNDRSVAAHNKLLERYSTINLELRPGVVNSLSDLDVGDTCLVVADRGRVKFQETHTVADLAFGISDEGVAAVRVGVIES